MNHLFTPLLQILNENLSVESLSVNASSARDLNSDLNLGLSAGLSSGLEYHEMGMTHSSESNVIEELKANLNQLEDLHFRLKYLMGEIGQHTRKRS